MRENHVGVSQPVSVVPSPEPDEPARLSNKELLSRIVSETSGLVRKEIELARSELTADLKSEVRMAKVLGAGALLALCGLTLSFVTVALLLAEVMPAWAAALIVTVLVLATAGGLAFWGWNRRVQSPLARTRRHLREDLKWVKRRLT